MDMSGSSMDMSNMTMEASQMIMSFFTSTHTALWSSSFQPSSSGSYAGMCIFLIILSVIYRSLFALKRSLETRWLHQAFNRRYIVVADRGERGGRDERVEDLKQGVLTVNGVDETIRVVQRPAGSLDSVQPWRFSVDLPRAGLWTVITGVGYLLMLAVMTLNVGYFLSILAGTFIGELAVGRFINVGHDH